MYTYTLGEGRIFKLPGCEGLEALDNCLTHEPQPLHSHLQNP